MEEVDLYRPHPKQREIHKALDTDIKYCIVSIGRQFGKSTLGENQSIKWALENNHWKVGWVSPIYKQAKKVFTYSIFYLFLIFVLFLLDSLI